MDWFFKLTSTIIVDVNVVPMRCLGSLWPLLPFIFVIKYVVILMFIYFLSHPLSHSCPFSQLLTTCFAHSEISTHLKIFSLRCGHHELLEFLCKLLEIVDCSGVEQTAKWHLVKEATIFID